MGDYNHRICVAYGILSRPKESSGGGLNSQRAEDFPETSSTRIRSVVSPSSRLTPDETATLVATRPEKFVGLP
jgi:hypothetical protein